jgi:hypothetical protein
MRFELLAALVIPWWSVAGWVSSLAEKNGFRPWPWFIASFLGGPIAWGAFYVKLRDRRERLGPGPRRAGRSGETAERQGERRGRTIR